jgi:hypothetical protein
MAAVLASVAVMMALTRQLSVGLASMTTIMFMVPGSTTWTFMGSPDDSAWSQCFRRRLPRLR